MYGWQTTYIYDSLNIYKLVDSLTFGVYYICVEAL